MVEPALDLGIQLFGTLLLLMMICAGVASMAPARQYRLFLGGALIAGLWIANVFLLKELSVRTSAAFLLDMICAIAFFFLAKPSATPANSLASIYDWASYIFGLFILIIVLELAQFYFRYDLPAEVLTIFTASLVLGIILWGIIRGFGVKFGLLFVLAVSIIGITSVNIFTYSLLLNFLTFLQILIIFSVSLPHAYTNITAKFAPKDNSNSPRIR